MLTLKSRINNVIWWHAGESIIYHSILLTHQSMLFAIAAPSIYGVIGTLFSTIYLAVNIINAGLDLTLSSLFTSYATSKQSLRNLMAIQLLINGSIGTLVGIILYTFWNKSSLSIPSLVLILLLILVESAKRISKILLQLNFQFRVTVLGELIKIVSYFCFVWSAYAIGFPITVYLIFVPLLVVGLIEAIIFFYYIYQWYQLLPLASYQSITKNDYKRIIKNRIVTFLNQFHHNCFSGNFLVLITAQFFGFDYAGIIKFATGFASNITIIIKKIFGISNNILSVDIKNNNITTQQNLFFLITDKMYHVLFCVSLFFIINYKFLLQTSDPSKNTIIYLSFLIIFIENFFTTYEQFYIMKEKTGLLLFISGITLTLLVLIYLYEMLFSLQILFLIILLIRFFSFILISIFSFFLWRLKPIGRLQPLFVISSLLISLIVKLIYR